MTNVFEQTRRKKWRMVVALLLLGGRVWAAPGVGGTEGEFLAWGAGARALAMGKAYVAMATDATAGYWNPAGLAFAERTDVQALHAQLWEGGAYDFLGAAVPLLSVGTFGWFGSVIGTGGGERRDGENNVLPGGFGVTKVGTGLAYGWEIEPGWGVGISFKWLGRWIDGEASGFLTGDLGMRWTAASWAIVGVVIQHAMSRRYGDTQDTLPVGVRCGAVLAPTPEWGKVAVEVESRSGSPVQWRVGFESPSFGPLTARAGMDTWEMAGGMGLRIDDLSLDYGAALHAELGLSHRVSVGLAWGEPQSSIRLARAGSAYERAVRAFYEAERLGRGAPAAREKLEEARSALEEVLSHDRGNEAASRLLQWVTASFNVGR